MSKADNELLSEKSIWLLVAFKQPNLKYLNLCIDIVIQHTTESMDNASLISAKSTGHCFNILI
jgi:hypothetical protein